MTPENAERRPSGAASTIFITAGDTAENTAGSSWRPIDLDATVVGLLTGTLTAPVPTVGRLSDGSAWLYAGRVNGLAGESGCGKTWTALQSVASELRLGNAAVYIDMEDNELGVVGRLLAMGVDPTLITSGRFLYLRPTEKFTAGREPMDMVLSGFRPSLVVIDSTGESLAMEGCDPNSDDGVARWFQQMPRWIADQGPAVLLLDHLPKANNGAVSPIGSQRKKAAISGVQFIQSVKKNLHFAKGRAGEAALACVKDRSGHFMTDEVAIKLIVNPNSSMADGSGCDVLMTPAADAEWAPTKHMTAISDHMESNQNALSTNQIVSAVPGKRETICEALGILAASGYLSVTPGSRGSRIYTFVKPYRNGDQITIPDDAGSDSGESDSGCEHDWHDGSCNPGWCHHGHHGKCNRE